MKKLISEAFFIEQLVSLGPLTLTLQLGWEVEAGGALLGPSSGARGVVDPIIRKMKLAKTKKIFYSC